MQITRLTTKFADRDIQPSPTASFRSVLILGLGCWLLFISGCAWPRLGRMDLGRKRPTCILNNPTQTELVSYLNENITQTPRWRCNDVRVSSRGALGIPVTLRAMMAVEEERNFRLVAHSPGGTEVDLGSNEERFWLYIRQAERPGVYTCRHELIDEAQRQMPMPLHPDWFTEVLGVVPIDNSEVEMQPHEKNKNYVYLIRNRQASETSSPVQLLTLVDCCQGVILEHRLQDTRGQPIAWARMGDFQTLPKSTLRIPHRVDLEWPQAKMGLTISMKKIDVSESPLPTELFDMPQIANTPVHEFRSSRPQNSQAPLQKQPVSRTREAEEKFADETEEFIDDTAEVLRERTDNLPSGRSRPEPLELQPVEEDEEANPFSE